jgi:hypothetical protein
MTVNNGMEHLPQAALTIERLADLVDHIIHVLGCNRLEKYFS